MSKKILITGMAGFMGNHLARYCLGQGAELYGWVRPGSEERIPTEIRTKSRIESFDMSDKAETLKRLKQADFDWIYHLAAKSHIGRSWEDPQDTLVTNISCQINLFECLRSLGKKPRILIAGSSEEYGIVTDGNKPVNECTALNPVSPYAVSKVAQDLMGLQYFRNYGLPIIRIRSFNQTGPDRNEQFVTSAFARQVAMIEAGLQGPTVVTGNLDAVRDFIDVRDGVRALWLAMDRCVPGEVYNICGGSGYPIRYILEALKKMSGASFEVRCDVNRIRPSDLPVLIGDGSKFIASTGWKPEITFEQSLEDLLNVWRKRVKE